MKFKNLFFIAFFAALTVMLNAAPSNVQAFYRYGQTFITWTEDGSSTYGIYRHTSAITSSNIGQAIKIATVDDSSSNCKYGIGAPIGQKHWVIDSINIVSDTGLGEELADSQGLFVHTTKEASGNFYYAVTVGGGTDVSLNVTGPIAESKAEIRPIAVYCVDTLGRKHITYTFFMDYSIWNPGWTGYIYNFLVCLTSNWRIDKDTLFTMYSFYGGKSTRLERIYSYPQGYSVAVKNDPVAHDAPTATVLQDWHYGHKNAAGDSVVNYSEYRIIKSLLFVSKYLKADLNSSLGAGGSMGGSGMWAMGSRYPSVFSAVYCDQGATDMSNPSFVWHGNIAGSVGSLAENLPIKNLRFDDPDHPELDEYLQKYNGTPVWDWLNLQEQLTVRVGDEMSFFNACHGRLDESIDWPTQGRPFGSILKDSKRTFSYIVNNSSHNWNGFEACNFGMLFTGGASYYPYKYKTNKSMPGFSGVNIPYDSVCVKLKTATWTVLQDSLDTWEMTVLAGEPCKITPRRCQGFDIYVNNVLTESDVEADEYGLVTTSVIDLTTAKTIKIVNTYRVSNPSEAMKIKAKYAEIAALPNPFNPDIWLQYKNPVSGRVVMNIYNLNGKLIKKVMDRVLPENQYGSAFWDATDESGKKVSSGIYIVIATGKYTHVAKSIVLTK